MKLFLILPALLLLFNGDHEPIATWKDPGKLYADNIGNIYTINGSVLSQYNHQGLKLNSYSNSHLGEITTADVSDPMRIMLFFENFNRIVFLSNKLSELGSSINLDDLGFSQVPSACASSDGGFWIYDAQSMQLVRFNSALQPEQKGTLLNNKIENGNSPTLLIEKNDMLFMAVPGTGILAFDKFGTYIATISSDSTEQFSVNSQMLQFLSGNDLIRYHYRIKTTDTIPLDIPYVPAQTAFFMNNLVLSNGQEIFIYKKWF